MLWIAATVTSSDTTALGGASAAAAASSGDVGALSASASPKSSATTLTFGMLWIAATAAAIDGRGRFRGEISNCGGCSGGLFPRGSIKCAVNRAS